MDFGNEVAKALAVLRSEQKNYKDYIPQEAIDIGNSMVVATRNLWEDLRNKIVEMIRNEIPLEYPHVAVWWYSVLMCIQKDKEMVCDFIKYVRKNQSAFSVNTRYFLYNQISTYLFNYPNLGSQEISKELWYFFEEIVDGFVQEITVSLDPIPVKKQNQDFVLVIINQFLAIQHGPTKTALDRCEALITGMGKKVLLVNTAELLSQVGKIPFCGCMIPNYMEENSEKQEIIWKGCVIPFCQYEDNMPAIEVLNRMLTNIRDMAPEYVISIDGSSIVGNLVGRMIPKTLALGTVPSSLEATTVNYQTLGRKLTSSEIELLKDLGYTKNKVIEGIFTSGLKEQTEHILRKDIGVSDESFLLVVVGARLDNEVTNEFLQMLEEVIEKNMYVGFFGNFSTYETKIQRFPILKSKSQYFGMCDDILSRMELCDLYINPIRTGGGTSCVEAMFKGVPVVTVDYGDVAVNAGKDFCVKDYHEMKKQIRHYYNDEKYYEQMSLRAKNRTEVLLDSKTEFIRIMNEMDKRETEREK